ncbi:DNA-binding FadR family transcriptional regulator [Microbacterium halimionae]|uniref:DNA-binding FadR family transcriptional regulator n=1 Tax=Microbacterium halimionae TaxID=1526413 RepID=A0A7W3JQ26_9MICO|nr:FCD domain-containing protein [Microbacterium halimionae]MBA8816813.1 DNA-binding FadR family transcriptional regulator [Microbacterium halimionae]NII94891.1 DNA-binding FadR family transcriptional regulator [Microbacterium halimionae]
MAKASHTNVLDDLGVRIASGDLTAGQVLTAAGLEADYGVSRTVIREAVRVLEAMGMLASRRRVGVTVQPAASWSALDTRLIAWQLAGPRRAQQLVVVTELRAGIEPIAARLAATRATDLQRSEILRLSGVLEKLGEQGLGDSDEYLAADIAFHDLILDASGNLMLAAVKRPIAEVIAGRSRVGLTPSVPVHEALHNHMLTAAAIARGDAEAAELHTRRYVDAVLGEVRGSSN